MIRWRVLFVAAPLALAGFAVLFIATDEYNRRKPRPLTMTSCRLGMVRSLCELYESEIGDFPKEESWCRELVLFNLKDNDFLKGNCCRESLSLFYDGWDMPFRYRRCSVRGKGLPEIWSVGPNGIDEQGAGDDLSILMSHHEERR
jgi:hypothetical protein